MSRDGARRGSVARKAAGVLALAVAALATLATFVLPAGAQILGTGEVRLVGLAVDLDTRPDLDGVQSTMTAIVDVPSGLLAVVGGSLGGEPVPGDVQGLPAGVRVRAELFGPSFATGVTIAALPNQRVELPNFVSAGEHFMRNVRLEDAAGRVLRVRDPEAPPIVIDVIEELLVTQVTSRPLSIDEIRERGIVIDESNFTVFDFTVGLTLGSEQVTIDLPVVLPSTPAVAAGLDAPTLQALQPKVVDLRKIDIPNFSLVGFGLRVPPEVEADARQLVPPVHGVIVIPGNIAFLNQFFSVVLQATNVAPRGSGFELRNARARIVLPTGADGFAATPDDPLRIAETVEGGVQEELALLDPRGGSAIVAQGTNAAEFLVEGLREGAHTVGFDLAGELFVPSLGRSVPMTGSAAGIVQVKNPAFDVVLAHPDVVRDGEPYSLFATVTNTSSSPANLFRLDLRERSLGGARLADGESPEREREALLPGESASFEYRLVALTTGRVTGTVFLADEGVNGSFVLTTGVGDTGIPLSPDTLVLPQTVDYLARDAGDPGDPDIVFATVRLLGQAYSVATAPAGALPPDVSRIGREFVFDRAVKLAQAGLHARFGEATAATSLDLLLDALGNDLARLDVAVGEDAILRQTFVRDARAFDGLRRASDAGRGFSRAHGALLGQTLAEADSLDAWVDGLGDVFASRPGFLLVALAGGNTQLRDAAGNTLGTLDPDAEEPATRDVPFGARLPLSSDAELLLVGAPTGAYELAFVSPAGGSASLSLIVPGASETGGRRVRYPVLSLAPGASGLLSLATNGSGDFALALDADGDGAGDTEVLPVSVETIADRPPRVIGVEQWAKGDRPETRPDFEHGDPLGRMVGVLFDEEVDAESAADASAYHAPGNTVREVSLQPDRRLAFAILEKPIGPFVARELEVSGVRDLGGRAMPLALHPIVADPDRGVGGRFDGRVVTADGRPVPFARVRYIQPLDNPKALDCFPKDFVVSTFEADGAGRFTLDYVLQNGLDEPCTADVWLSDRNARGTDHFKLEAEDPERGTIAKLSTRIQFDGQHMELRVVMRGLGAIAGTVVGEDGAPVVGGAPGTLPVLAENLSTGERYLSWVDADGRFAFPARFEAADGDVIEAPGVAVGNLVLQVIRPGDFFTGVTTVNVPAAGATAQAEIVLFDPLRYGTVRGRVVEADGSTPAANVPIQLAAPVLSGVTIGSRVTREGVVGAAVSDASGGFLFENVPTGEIRVRALRQATFEQADAVSFLEPGETAELIVVLPGGGGRVRGLVTDPLGNPIPGAAVAGGFTRTETDEDGRFEIDRLPLGNVTIFAQGTASQALGKLPVSTAGPGDLQEIVIQLEPVASVVGRVLRADGVTPVLAQKVQLWLEPNEGIAAETYTDPDGRYAFHDFPLGRYSVRAIERGTLEGGSVVTDLRFAGDVRVEDVVFRGQGEIHGRVVQTNGTPVISDVLITRKVWKILTDIGIVDNAALGLAILEQFAQIEGLEESVARAIEENRLQAAKPEFFVLVDETALVSSDVLGPGGEVTGRFAFPGPATGGPFTVAAFGPFLAPAEKRGEIPRTTNPAERVVDVGDIVLEPATGGVMGRVLLPDGETPVGEGVGVRLRSLGNSGSVLTASGVQQQPVLPDQSTTTDADGFFAFPLVLRGSFVLTADTFVPPAGIAATRPEEIRTDAFEDGAGERVLNVRLFGRVNGALPAGETLDLELRLEDAAAARVRVVESDGGTPVQSARVVVSTASTLDVDPEPAFTDSNGQVDFFPIPEGGLSFRVTVPGSTARGSAAATIPRNPPNGFIVPVTVQLGAVTTSSGEVVTAEIFGSVGGRVFDASGAPLSNPAEVTIKARGIDVLAVTDEEGGYLAENVPGGPFRVEVFEPFSARRGDGAGRIGFDGEVANVDVTLIGLGRVLGEVFDHDGSEMISGVDLVLAVAGRFSDPLRTRSRPDGSFELPGVPLGSYMLMASDPIRGLSGEADGVMARDGDVNNTDVFLEPSAALSGVVYAAGVVVDGAGATSHPNGTPFPGAPVAAGASVEIRALRQGGVVRTVQADANGVFGSGEFLPLGGYSIVARPTGGGDGARGSVELLFDGENAFVPLALRGTGDVGGVLLDSTGSAPVEGASVTLSSESEFAAGAITRITDEDGGFAFADVPIGELSISVRTNLQTPALGAAALAELGAHGEQVVFADDDADLSRDAIRLQDAGAIDGRVLASDANTPAEDVVVLLTGNGQRVVRRTDGAGRFAFQGIPLGSYDLTFQGTLGAGVASRTVLLVANGDEIALGDIVLDDERPVVLSTSPRPSSIDAPPAGAIEVVFSEPVSIASLSPTTFRVRVGAAAVAGAFEVPAGSGLARFTPDAPLPDRSRVTVELRADRVDFDGRVSQAGVRDLAGLSIERDLAFQFTTGDRRPPALLSQSPRPDAVEVATASVVRVEFDEPLAPESVREFELLLDGSTVAGSAAFGVGSGNRLLVFQPSAPLLPDRLYAARITGPLRDPAGNAMAEATLEWSFATRDTLAPEVEVVEVAASPLLEGRAVGVAATVPAPDVVRVDFYVNGALRTTDATPPFGFSFTPTAAHGSPVELGAIAEDRAGNRSPRRTVAVGVVSNAAPSVTIVAPAAGTAVSQGDRLVVRVDASDDLGLASLAISANDGAAGAAGVALSGETSATRELAIDVPVALAAGSALLLRAAATDGLGRVGRSAELTLQVEDRLPPAVSVGFPAPGAIVDPGTTVRVFVRADDAAGVSALELEATGAATLADVRSLEPAATPATATFDVVVPSGATPGAAIQLLARARDTNGLEATRELAIRVRDGSAPEVALELESAAAGGPAEVELGEEARVRALASDALGVVRVDLEAVGLGAQSRRFAARASTAQSFGLPVPATLGPDHTIEVRATAFDADGNAGSADPLLLTTVDTTPPGVVIVSPEPDSEVVPGGELTLSVSAEDRVAVASVSCAASGALADASVATIDPPRPSVLATCTFSVPEDAPTGATIELAVHATDTSANASSAATRSLRVADVVPPELRSIVPADGATGVAPDALIELELSEPVEESSLLAAFSLIGPEGATTGSISSGSGPGAYRFTPDVALSADATYAVGLATTLVDLAGNALAAPFSSSFTVQSDFEGPCIVALEPADGTPATSLEPEIRARFDEPVDPASIDATRVGLLEEGSGRTLAFEVGFEENASVVVLRPTQPFAPAEPYAVTWTTGITDSSGNALQTASACAGGAVTPGTTAARQRFATGGFALVAPADGAVVVEGELLDAHATASSALGLRSLAFLTDGRVAAAESGGVEFRAPVAVPTLAELGDSELPIGLSVAYGSSLAQRPGATATANSEQPGFEAQRAIDGDAESAWRSAEPAGGTLELVLAREARVGELVVRVEPGAGAALGTAVFELLDANGVVLHGEGPLPLSDPETRVAVPATAGVHVVRLIRSGADAAIPGVAELEVYAGSARSVLATLEVRAADADDDGDGLSNGEEIALGTDPFDPDTDGDGVPDGDDVDPTRPAPVVLGFVPVDGASGVALVPAISAEVSQALDPATVTGANVRLRPEGEAPLAADLSLEDGGRRIRITPRDALLAGTAYRVELTTGLATPAGEALAEPASSGFTTGAFAITSPRDGSRVAEQSELTLEARAAAGLGIADVEFRVNGELLPAVPGSTTFLTTYGVPSAESTPSLVIEAQARDAAGDVLLDDRVEVVVTAGMRFVPRILGVPLDGSALATLEFSSVLAEPLELDFRANGDGVVSLPTEPVVIPAGVERTTIAIDGVSVGATTVIASSSFAEAPLIVSVSEATPGREVRVEARAAGARSRPVPTIARALLRPGTVTATPLRLLAEPAAVDTVFEVASSDPGVATVDGPVVVPTGERDATVSFVAGGAGRATLVFHAGEVARAVDLIVGSPAPGVLPPVLAPTAGVRVAPVPTVARAFVLPGSGGTLVVRVLPEPVAGDTTVSITSDDPAIVSVPGDVTVPAGERDATFEITAAAEGVATLRLQTTDIARDVQVFVGTPPSGRLAPVLAPVAGLHIVPIRTSARAYLLAGEAPALEVRLLDVPAVTETVFDVTSSDPAVATVVGSVRVPAGERSATVPFETGAPGVASLEFRAGSVARRVEIVVGAPPPTQRIPTESGTTGVRLDDPNG